MPPRDSKLRIPDSTLHSFVVLEENRAAFTAVERLSTPVSGRGRLVFLYGLAGVGKSHLACRFVRDLRSANRELRLEDVTAAEFAAQYAEDTAERIPEEFDRRFRELDAFVCEDIQALRGRAKTQRKLVSILDDVLSCGGPVLVTSTLSLGELSQMLPRLVNRLRGGTCLSMTLPGRRSRAALIAHFAASRQIPLSPDVCDLLAESLAISPRELLATIVHMETCARLARRRIDVAFARGYLEGDVTAPPPNLRQIATAVARQFERTVTSLRSPTRQHGHLLPRQCAMFLARELTSEPLDRIAEYFGRKTHSTVLHACKRIEHLLKERPALRRRMADVRRALGVTR